MHVTGEHDEAVQAINQNLTDDDAAMSEEESSEKGEESLEETSSDYDVLIPR